MSDAETCEACGRTLGSARYKLAGTKMLICGRCYSKKRRLRGAKQTRMPHASSSPSSRPFLSGDRTDERRAPG